MQICLQKIMTQDISDCLVIINEDKTSMAIPEANQLQTPIVSLMDPYISNKFQLLITYFIPVNNDSIQFVYLFCNSITKTVILSQSAWPPLQKSLNSGYRP